MWAIELRLAQPRPRRLPIDRVVLALGLELVRPKVLDLPVLGVDAQGHSGLGDVGEHDLAHAVIRKRQVADRLPEENLVADGSGLGHRDDVVGVGLMHDTEHGKVAQRLGSRRSSS